MYNSPFSRARGAVAREFHMRVGFFVFKARDLKGSAQHNSPAMGGEARNACFCGCCKGEFIVHINGILNDQ